MTVLTYEGNVHMYNTYNHRIYKTLIIFSMKYGIWICPKMYSLVMCALCRYCSAESSINWLWLGKYSWKDNSWLNHDSFLMLPIGHKNRPVQFTDRSCRKNLCFQSCLLNFFNKEAEVNICKALVKIKIWPYKWPALQLAISSVSTSVLLLQCLNFSDYLGSCNLWCWVWKQLQPPDSDHLGYSLH